MIIIHVGFRLCNRISKLLTRHKHNPLVQITALCLTLLIKQIDASCM